MLIYLVTNLANGKKYVGQTRLRLEHRWKQHVRDAGNGSSTLIGAAIRKYGTDAFSVSIICTRSSQAELDTAERFYISSLGTHSSTGNGTALLENRSLNTCEKLCACIMLLATTTAHSLSQFHK